MTRSGLHENYVMNRELIPPSPVPDQSRIFDYVYVFSFPKCEQGVLVFWISSEFIRICPTTEPEVLWCVGGPQSVYVKTLRRGQCQCWRDLDSACTNGANGNSRCKMEASGVPSDLQTSKRMHRIHVQTTTRHKGAACEHGMCKICCLSLEQFASTPNHSRKRAVVPTIPPQSGLRVRAMGL